MAVRYDNWAGKMERAETAKRHTAEMDRHYGLYIRQSLMNTWTYSPGFSSKRKPGGFQTVVTVEDLDSVSAVFRHHQEGREAVLNFSSYKHPGGMFLGGSRAQEECLCHESTLYNVLREKRDFYRWNNLHKNNSLYENRALYSGDIVFVRDGTAVLCDVITCAAPNRSAAERRSGMSGLENMTALRSRIAFVLDVAKENGVETLILGAYGCGVFGQDPKYVASVFHTLLDEDFRGVFRRVVFAIPKRDTDTNYEVFLSEFG